MYIPSDDELDDFIGDNIRPFCDGSSITRDDTLGMVEDLRRFILNVLEKNLAPIRQFVMQPNQ